MLIAWALTAPIILWTFHLTGRCIGKMLIRRLRFYVVQSDVVNGKCKYCGYEA